MILPFGKGEKFFLIGFLLLIFTRSIFAQNFMSWGLPNTISIPNYINEIRLGCPSDPEFCVNKIKNYSSVSLNKVSLSIGWKDVKYDELLLQIPRYVFNLRNQEQKVELSIDDFGGFLKKYKMLQASNILQTLIINKRLSTSPITIGLTVYEDEIEFIDTSLSDEKYIRDSVDRVALYLHHRNSIDLIDNYINKIKTTFPNARIYLGVYHYDRSDYISCDIKTSKLCTEDQELLLFEKAFKFQFNLFKSKKIDGLEFYPGNFNNEAFWTGWNNERICKKSRLVSCINLSKAMSTSVISRIQDFSRDGLIK